MANCLDQILCNQASDCNISITDENGFEIDTRYLHDGDTIYLYVGDRIGYTLQGFSFLPYDGTSRAIYPEYIGNNLYRTQAICGGTFIAHFSTNIYELTVIPDNDIHGSTLGSGRYPYNTVVHISAIENTGYHFIGWYINDVLISNSIEYSYNVINNAIIVAKFEGDEYSIVAKPNNRLLGSASGSGVYEIGTVVTLSATPFAGSRFISWDDTDTNTTKTITVTGNKIYIANFQRNKYTVTVIIINASATRPSEVCGVVTGDGTYEYGTLVTLYASPALGFNFVSWDNGPEHVDDTNRYSFTLQGNTTIYATFDDAMYTLTLYSSPTNGGYTTNSVSADIFNGGTYRYNTIVPAQALPYSGYLFDRWSDGTLSDVRSFTMTSDITQTAYFMPDIPRYTLKISFNSNKGNVVIMNGLINIASYSSGYAYATVDSGTVLTAIVTVNAPYTFNGWDDSSTEGMTRIFTLNENITREVYFSEVTYYRICLCSNFNFNAAWVEVTYSNGQVIAELRNASDRCVVLEEGADVLFIYHSLDSDYHLNDWGTLPFPYEVLDDAINFTVSDNAEICPDVEYINPFIPQVYVNIDFTQECKNEFAGNIPSLYGDYTYITKTEDGTYYDSITPIPPMDGPFDPDFSLTPVEVYTTLSPGDAFDLWAKTTGQCAIFHHWIIKLVDKDGNTQTSEIYNTHVSSIKFTNKTLYATAVYTCCSNCRGTFTINDPEVKFQYNGIMYNYTGSAVSFDLVDGEEVTVYPYDNSKYIGGIYDVTDPTNPIDVTQIASTMATGSFCYEPYPQTDNNGYISGYNYVLTNSRFFDSSTPDMMTMFRKLHTDTNYSSSSIYINPSTVTWNNTQGDANRNSFGDQPGDSWTELPIWDSTYNFNQTYYRFYFNGYYSYFEKVTKDINTIPTLPEFPATASINNQNVSPYLVKVPATYPQYPFTQGYNIYMIYHERSCDYDPWNDISGIITSGTEEWNPRDGMPVPTASSKRFLTDKSSNATYVKRINSITFTPQCNHVYELCGLGIEYSPRQYMYLLLSSYGINSDDDAVAQGVIPESAKPVPQLPNQAGTTRYLSLADLTYYNPISASSLGNYVKAMTEYMCYYQIVEICPST